MQYNKTSCTQCHGSIACSDKTKVYINYCGSQREKNKTQFMMALTECRSRRGQNYASFKNFVKGPENKFSLPVDLEPALST
ncbi:MAG: hypothetical protein V1913_01580 [Fibrobacterota bacterium]